METIFISDLHLSLDRPEKLDNFKKLLQGPARNAKALYILGDLFEEFWVGNDDKTPPNQEIINELVEYVRSGANLYLTKGNRELLLDDNFGTLSGAKILPDFAIIDLDGKRVLLMHGDLLCTRDVKYQIYRKILVNPITRLIIKLMPYRLRIFLSHGLRSTMDRSVMQKTKDIMDVEPSAVNTIMQKYNVTELIHGHTHRPDIHNFMINGSPVQRIVLGDWYHDAEILLCKNEGRKLIQIDDYLKPQGQ